MKLSKGYYCFPGAFSFLYIMLLSFNCFIRSSAQNLLQEGKIWSNLEYGTERPELQDYHSYYLKVDGDTTIESQTYKKLFRSDDPAHASWISYGFMREEPTGQVYALRVSQIPETMTKETLLYDFGLEKGDSIASQHGFYLRVDSVEQVAYDGGSYKTIFLDGTYPWIAGIGSTGGLLAGLPRIGIVGVYPQLVCCSEESGLLYKNPEFDECYVTNVYVPFDFENGEWFCYYCKKGGYFFKQLNNYYSFETVKLFCDGDTTIDGIPHFKLFYKGYAESQVLPKTAISGYVGYIRNDLVHRRVLCNGRVLYDFGQRVGDSLHIVDGFDHLLSIDKVQDCKQDRQRYHYTNYNLQTTCTITEGIGSNHGLFDITQGPQISSLLCYQEKGNSNCDTCGKILQVADLRAPSIRIFPNPITEQSQIEFRNLANTPFLLDVYNSNGQLVFSHSGKGNSPIRIGALHLPRGICLYRLVNETQQVSGKFVVP